MESVDRPQDVADWQRVEGLWRQCVDVLATKSANGVHLPDSLVDDLAKHTARVFASYDTREKLFVEHLLAVMSEDNGGKTGVKAFRDLYYDSRFDDLPSYQASGPGRRRPRPFEASVETARRLRDLGRIQDQLADLEVACILGGSASYGRFYNTTGAQVGKPSDLDLLLVLAPGATLEDVLQRLQNVRGIEDVADAHARAANLPALRKHVPEGRLVFSHKFQLWETVRDKVLDDRQLSGGYRLSLHIVTLEEFHFIILHDLPSIPNGQHRRIWDYRQSDPERHDVFRSFSGTETKVERAKREVEDGYLAESVVYTSDGGRFRPGLHQNLVLPQFDLRWDGRRHRIRLPLYGFRWKVTERLSQEKRSFPYEVQRISLSHTRSAVFAPHIAHRVDRNA